MNKSSHRFTTSTFQSNANELNDVETGTSLILPGLVDDYAQRIETEAKQAADARAGMEKINLHPDLIGKIHSAITTNLLGWHNFLKSCLQHLINMCELCKSYVKLYNTFSLQKEYLYKRGSMDVL